MQLLSHRLIDSWTLFLYFLCLRYSKILFVFTFSTFLKGRRCTKTEENNKKMLFYSANDRTKCFDNFSAFST